MLYKKFLARALHLVAVMFMVSLLAFSMLALLPGNLAHTLAGERATAEDLAKIEQEFGLDKSMPERFLRWTGKALTGDLGVSPTTREDVAAAVIHRIPVSLQLMIMAQVMALLIALPVGLYAGSREGGQADKLITSVSFGVLAIPNFVLGILLILLFAIQLRWLPATGYTAFSADPLANIRSMALPALTLALLEAPVYTRILRTELATTLREEYINVARAKGLSRGRTLLTHALRPSLFGLVTIMGINIGHLIGGAVIVETLFALPGVGRLLIEAVTQRDFLTVQGVVLFIALAFVLVNLAIDLLYLAIDPRLRRPVVRN